MGAVADALLEKYGVNPNSKPDYSSVESYKKSVGAGRGLNYENTLAKTQAKPTFKTATDMQKKKEDAQDAKSNINAAQIKKDRTQKEYEEYIASDEYKQRLEEQELQQRQADIVKLFLPNTAPDLITPKVIRDEKEERLRAARDQAEAEYNASEDQKVIAQDLEAITGLSEEERRQLEAYAVGRVRDQNQTFELQGVAPTAQQEAAELIQKYGQKRVDEMSETYMRQQNAELARQVEEQARQQANEHGFWSSLATVPVNAISGVVGTVGQLQGMVRGTGRYKTLDPNEVGTIGDTYSGAVRGQVQQNIEGEDPNFLRKAASVGYQGVMSAADSIARAYLGGGAFGGAALAATGSFSQTMAEASQRGATPTQAALLATATAGIEALSEEIPLDNLIRTAKGGGQTVMQAISAALKQAGIEATTEEVSLLGTLLADAAIMQEKSSYQLSITSKILQGINPTQARDMANKELLDEAVNTALVSAASGGMSSLGGSAVAKVRENMALSRIGSTGTPANVQEAIAEAKRLDAQQQNQQQPEAEQAPQEAVQPQTEAQPVQKSNGELIQEAMANRVREIQQQKQAAEAQTEQAPAEMQEDNTEVQKEQQEAPKKTVADYIVDSINRERGVKTDSQTTQVVQEALNVQSEPQTQQETTAQEQPATAQQSSAPQVDTETAPDTASPVQQEQSTVGGQIKGTGAAEQNFTGKAEYENLLTDENTQRDRSTSVRLTEVPKVDGYGRNVSEFVGNIYGAAVTPDRIANEIESLVQAGALSYDRRTNREALDQAATEIKNMGEEATLEAIHDSAQKGRIQDGDIEKALLLYAKFANDPEEQYRASTLIVDMKELSSRSGRNLQLWSLMQKMTPEGQLMTIQKNVDNYIKEVNKTRSGKKKIGGVKNPKAQATATDAVETAKEETAKKISTASGKVRYRGGKVTVEGNQSGEPFVFEYAEKVGEALAKGLVNSQKTKKPKTFMQTITSELRKFANEKLPPSQKSRNLTATELLKDYIQNQDFYNQAWEAAQQKLRDDGVNNPAFQEFMNSGIGVDANADPRNKIFAKALAAAAMESGETTNVLRKQQALGVTNMSETIAQKLIQDTGATGEMAQTIRDAAKDYVAKRLNEIDSGKPPATDPVESSIRSAMKDIEVTLSDLAVQNSTTRETAKQAIVRNLSEKYGFGEADASRVADVVGQQYSRMVQDQAKKILDQKFRPREKYQKKSAEKVFNELVNLGAFDIGSQYNAQATDRAFGTEYGIGINQELAAAYKEAKTEEAKQVIMDAMYKDIAAQIKPTIGEMWDAWRNMAMLMNAKTHERNFLSTGAFKPFTAVKRDIAAALEYVFVDKENRTRAILGGGKKDKDLLKWARADSKTKDVRDLMDYSGTTGNQARSAIEDYRQILPKWVDKGRKGNMAIMEREDMVWKKSEYAASLAGFLKARGYTAEQAMNGQIPKDVLIEGRQLAVNDALKATFNDRNQFSDAMAKFRVKGDSGWAKALNAIAKGVLPFTRTPANVVVRVTDYSPIGLAKGFDTLARKVRTGEATVSQGIDQIASGLTGTGVMVLGAALAHGLIPGVRLIGKMEEDDERRAEGAIEYSVKIGDTYYGLGFLAPAAIPLFIGANLYDTWNSAKGGELDGWDVMDALMGIGADIIDPMLELSMLGSLNDVVDAYSNEETYGEGLLAAVTTAAANYFTQGLPTILGQAEQATETEKTTTYINTDNPTEARVKRIVSNATQRIPLGDAYRTTKLDEFGEPVKVEGNAVTRTFNAFLNPFTVSKAKSDPVREEITRLNKVQEESVTPPYISKVITYTDSNGDLHENYRLSEEEYTKIATTQGQTAKRIIETMLNSKNYQAMSDAEKAKAIKQVYTFAREKAMVDNIKDHTGYSESWMMEMREGKESEEILRRITNSELNRTMTNLDSAWDNGYNTESRSRELAEAFDSYSKMTAAQKREIRDFATGTTAKYIEAREKGISHENFLKIAKAINNAKGTGAYNEKTGKNTVREIDKRKIIAQSGLSETDIDRMMMVYMEDYDPDKKGSDTSELKYNYIRQELGLSPTEYVKAYEVDLEGGKWRNIRKGIQDALGCDWATANSLLLILEGQKREMLANWYKLQ